MKIYCCSCGKQAIYSQAPSRFDKYCTKAEGGRAGFKANEIFCGYCAEEMDENGLFPEEAAQVRQPSDQFYDYHQQPIVSLVQTRRH